MSLVPPDPYLPPAGDEPRSREDLDRFERELDERDRRRAEVMAIAIDRGYDIVNLSEIEAEAPPRCPDCDRSMRWHGSTYGWTCWTIFCPNEFPGEDEIDRMIEASRAEVDAAADPSNHWTPLPFMELANTPVSPPEIARLFYCRQRHVLSGEADLGKTWIMLWATVEEIQAGHTVLWVNTDEAPPGELLERLTILGLTHEQIEASFLYLQPDYKSGVEEIAALVTLAQERGVRLVVVDSFNSAMMVEGLDPLGTVDVETFWRNLATPLCRAGCAFVAIDHLPKSSENHGRYSFGSERKLSGASVHIGVRGQGFSREHGGGTVKLWNLRDRSGYHPNYRKVMYDFKLTVAGRMGSCELVEVDESEAGRLTGFMEKVSRALEGVAPDGLTVRQIEEAVTGKSVHVRKALNDLVEDGYVTRVKDGKSLVHTVTRPYVIED